MFVILIVKLEKTNFKISPRAAAKSTKGSGAYHEDGSGFSSAPPKGEMKP